MKTVEMMCDALISDREIIKSAFKWDSEQFYPVCANLFLTRDKEPDPNALRACRDLIKEQTGIFSAFRGNAGLPMICLISLAEDPAAELEKTLRAHQALRRRFAASDYLALAAWSLKDMDVSALDSAVDHSRELYDRMRKEHPFLTGSEDTVFTVLMALSGRDDDALIADMEESYTILKARFKDSDSVQSISHILALDLRSPAEKTARFTALYDAVIQYGMKYGRGRELALLAAPALTDTDPAVLAREMLTAYDRLEGVKGWTGLFGYDRRQRAAHAAMLVADLHPVKADVSSSLIPQQMALNAVIAQQMMMCAAIAASAAASSAAASSSH